MTKQTITTEIDIPDGYELAKHVHSGLFVDNLGECLTVVFRVRPIWQPPSWMRPGWIFCSESMDRWFWSSGEVFATRFGWNAPEWVYIYRDGKPTVGDFTPPPCDDWRTSKRRVGGAE